MKYLILGAALYLLALAFCWALCKAGADSDEATERWMAERTKEH